MTLTKTIFWGAGMIGFVSWLGCSDAAQPLDHLEAYRQHIVAARADLNAETAEKGDGYLYRMHQQVGHHLDEMTGIREKMSASCSDLADCEHGGGATGKIQHGCMHGGHLLSPREMERLGRGEEGVLDTMRDFSEQCASDPSLCHTSHIEEHQRQIENLLDDMLYICDDMMGEFSNRGTDRHVGMCRRH